MFNYYFGLNPPGIAAIGRKTMEEKLTEKIEILGERHNIMITLIKIKRVQIAISFNYTPVCIIDLLRLVLNENIIELRLQS
ncbi:uncharacterized protein OCT59_006165 [Rhizophagus irregularis]|uniref:Uncharacterized protein n=2 Tax=Rhizophagus irregularis TaxID=588596 RepID=A0A015K6K5_RHIIW|nr:hypothetical protein RirG_043960 [Rhizophagus irregularis DAOM 197198w]UZO14716.1 hypothetical protein OCT59_006165 [Rhizophagus irregularis]